MMLKGGRPAAVRTLGKAPAGPWLWILCFQFLVCEQIARLGWTLPYSFRRNYISDLGATVCSPLVCSPWHAVMNVSFACRDC